MADPWVKFYSSDWLAGTSGLSAAERGVYITLIALIYEYDGPVPLDHQRLARRCGLPAGTFKRVLAALIAEGKIYSTDDGLCNKRAFSECNERKNRIIGCQTGARKTNALLAEKRQQKQGEGQRSAIRAAIREPEPEPDISTDVDIYRRKRATRLPEKWELPQEWGNWAVREGWAPHVVRQEAEKFRDFWIAKGGQNARKRDWQATWRNWMRNVKRGTDGKITSKGEERVRAFLEGARRTS